MEGTCARPRTGVVARLNSRISATFTSSVRPLNVRAQSVRLPSATGQRKPIWRGWMSHSSAVPTIALVALPVEHGAAGNRERRIQRVDLTWRVSPASNRGLVGGEEDPDDVLSRDRVGTGRWRHGTGDIEEGDRFVADTIDVLGIGGTGNARAFRRLRRIADDIGDPEGHTRIRPRWQPGHARNLRSRYQVDRGGSGMCKDRRIRSGAIRIQGHAHLRELDRKAGRVDGNETCRRNIGQTTGRRGGC